MIQFASVLILYTNKTNLGDTQFLYIDLVITTTVAVLMGRTRPWSSLSPMRPPGSLVTGPTLASIAGQVVASAGGQLLATTYLHSRPWWSPLRPHTPEEEIVVSYATTTPPSTPTISSWPPWSPWPPPPPSSSWGPSPPSPSSPTSRSFSNWTSPSPPSLARCPSTMSSWPL